MEKKAVIERLSDQRPKSPAVTGLGNRDQQRTVLPCSAAENQQGPHRPEIKSKQTVVSRPVHHASALILIHI